MTKIKTPSKIIQKIPITLITDELPIVWVNEISLEKAQDFIKEIIRLNSDPDVKEIFIFISSYGGDVFAVLGMVEIIQKCSKPVHTVGLGICASGGGILLAAGPDERYITENSFMHIHHVQTAMFGDLPGIQQDAIQTQKVEDKIFELITRRSSLNIKQLREKLMKNNREWQLTAEEALKLGFVDYIGMPVLKRYIVLEKE